MLLLLPGLICDARVFAPQLAAFADSRAVDGYGTVDALEGMARVALEQAPESFDLFGHSMGARVALEVYRLAPERVRRLALCSTGVHPLGAEEPAKRRALQAIGHARGTCCRSRRPRRSTKPSPPGSKASSSGRAND